ncbi:hypothetical protein, partial [Pseudomonas sp. SB113]|uniref:hypothetical protein n=1 Tax=Pseudomonas sp. SB113 TaxID=3154123 RepID=UPI00345CC701
PYLFSPLSRLPGPIKAFRRQPLSQKLRKGHDCTRSPYGIAAYIRRGIATRKRFKACPTKEKPVPEN